MPRPVNRFSNVKAYKADVDQKDTADASSNPDATKGAKSPLPFNSKVPAFEKVQKPRGKGFFK